MKYRTAIMGALLLYTLLACQAPEAGISPIGAIPEIPPKLLMAGSRPVGVICHIDTERYNPLNVIDYYFGNQDSPHVPLFEYAVLGHAYIVKDRNDYVHLELAPALRNVLENSRIFLKPLREKGIKILIEVRSGNYADDEAGEGYGLGTLDMASIESSHDSFRLLVDRFGIDGFEFNDTGGGYQSYPPYTRNLKQFQSDAPLYPDSMFKYTVPGTDDEEYYSDDIIEALLWREGGSNVSNLIQRTNESLRETHTVAADYGRAENDNQIIGIRRTLLVRDRGHGGFLINEIRDIHMPDAYSGANGMVLANLAFVIHDSPHDTGQSHMSLFDEKTNSEAGKNALADSQYAPFIIDLSGRLGNAEAAALSQWFTGTQENPKGYGAVYFTHLPPISQVGAESVLRSYLTLYTRALFGRTTRLYEGGGDYR